MKYRILSVSALLAIAFLVACGGGGDTESEESSGPESVTLEIVQNDIYYGSTPDNMDNPPRWEAFADGRVVLEITNNGTSQHNWAVINKDAELPATFDSEANADLIFYQAGLLEPGTEFRESFFAPTEPGEYVVICTVAGHYPSMQGRLVVN